MSTEFEYKNNIEYFEYKINRRANTRCILNLNYKNDYCLYLKRLSFFDFYNTICA